MAGRARQILFRIFYSTSFTIVFLLLLAFSCAAPIDAMYQSYKRSRLIDMFIIAGVYIVTGLIALFLYASRLYTNRSVLKDIPKTFMPLEKNELPGKRIWRLIEDCKSRSAVIAYQARPRSRRIENELPNARERISTLLKPEHSRDNHMFEPQWGTIAHPGWSSPASSELPDLEYAKVISELTDLIEARAVSLAPNKHTATQINYEGQTVDPTTIELLKRPEEFGMRAYLIRLISLGMLDDNSLTTAYLTLYERARFAAEPLSDFEFQALMRMFAETLRSIRPPNLDENIVGKSHVGLTSTTSELPRQSNNSSNETSSFSSAESGSVRRILRQEVDDTGNSIDAEDDKNHDDSISMWTAPTSRPPFTSRSASRNIPSSTPSRQRLRNSRSQKSVSSARSSRSRQSESGSVLRLNSTTNEGSEALPYIITVPEDDR